MDLFRAGFLLGEGYTWNGGCDVKKRSWGILLAAATLGLSGCGGVQLTDQQTSEAAEYMAGLILKYDKDYTDTLVYPDNTEEPVVTSMPAASSAPEQSGNSNTEGKTDEQGNSDTGKVSSEGSFAEVLGVSDVKVSLKDAYITKEYKETANGSYAVYPASGKKLAVVRLTIKNTSAKDKKIYLIERGVDYQLQLSDGTTCSSEITVISNDLNFLNTKIKAGKKTTAVLVFNVPKSVKKIDGVLRASAEENTATIALSEK